MKKAPEERILTIKGVAMAVIFFSVYGLILFSEDPDWVHWAWPMAMGVLYVPNPPPPLFSDPRGAFEMGFAFYLFSLLALVFVGAIRGEAFVAWLSWLKARWSEARQQASREARERPEVGVGALSLDVDFRP
ncbi:MAG: hypothetical protein ACREJP_06200 [Candidatus Methylomirabilales bacterium]